MEYARSTSLRNSTFDAHVSKIKRYFWQQERLLPSQDGKIFDGLGTAITLNQKQVATLVASVVGTTYGATPF
jgi:hypothetical protein